MLPPVPAPPEESPERMLIAPAVAAGVEVLVPERIDTAPPEPLDPVADPAASSTEPPVALADEPAVNTTDPPKKLEPASVEPADRISLPGVELDDPVLAVTLSAPAEPPVAAPVCMKIRPTVPPLELPVNTEMTPPVRDAGARTEMLPDAAGPKPLNKSTSPPVAAALESDVVPADRKM